MAYEKPQSISYEMINTLDVKSDAQLILIVEKDGIFKRLYEDKFFDLVPCVIITGRGFPDLATRAFTHFLMTQLRLPIFGICDWNPYGAALLMTYILGSLTSGIESYRYCVPMTWIGLHYTDITSLKLPDVVKQPFTRLDASKIKALKE